VLLGFQERGVRWLRRELAIDVFARTIRIAIRDAIVERYEEGIGISVKRGIQSAMRVTCM
jgi:hypothetical protein